MSEMKPPGAEERGFSLLRAAAMYETMRARFGVAPDRETARRWAHRWGRAADHYGGCCASALHEGDLAGARAFADLWHRCDQRAWWHSIRTALYAADWARARASAIDWFGDEGGAQP